MRALLLATVVLTGCLAVPASEVLPEDLGEAAALALPATDFYDREGSPNRAGLPVSPPPFHTLEELWERMEWFNATYPGLVELREIGRSREDRPIRMVVVTDETTPGPKRAPLIDAGHHANELAGIAHALYVVDYLLENREHPEIRRILRENEIHVVPLVNPDGYVRQTRGNALGVNLNRNYDLDWGNPLGASSPVSGKVANATGLSVPSVAIFLENCGAEPFSEPETRAMRDLMASLGERFAFYLTIHTPTNGFVGPWSAYDPPFPLTPEQDLVIEAALEWVRTNTEYEAGKTQWGNFSAGLPYSASGSSQDFAFAVHRVPAFTFEIEIWHASAMSKEGDWIPRGLPIGYDGLPYWMAASIPVPMYLLANSAALAAWEAPVADPPLPEGVPPPVPKDRVRADDHFHI